MNMMDIARRDARTFVTSKSGGFAVDAVLIDTNDTQASLPMLHSSTYITYNEDRAAMVNMKGAHLCFSEAELKEIAPTYVLRNTIGEVEMTGHKCVVKDSTGEVKTYQVKEHWPDETLGLIVCILGQFE